MKGRWSVKWRAGTDNWLLTTDRPRSDWLVRCFTATSGTKRDLWSILLKFMRAGWLGVGLAYCCWFHCCYIQMCHRCNEQTALWWLWQGSYTALVTITILFRQSGIRERGLRWGGGGTRAPLANGSIREDQLRTFKVSSDSYTAICLLMAASVISQRNPFDKNNLCLSLCGVVAHLASVLPIEVGKEGKDRKVRWWENEYQLVSWSSTSLRCPVTPSRSLPSGLTSAFIHRTLVTIKCQT